MESTENSYEEKMQELIEKTLEDARVAGERIGIAALTFVIGTSEQASFLAKAKKEFENGIETAFKFSYAQKLLYTLGVTAGISNENLAKLIEEALK